VLRREIGIEEGELLFDEEERDSISVIFVGMRLNETYFLTFFLFFSSRKISSTFVVESEEEEEEFRDVEYFFRRSEIETPKRDFLFRELRGILLCIGKNKNESFTLFLFCLVFE
jgi:hypothetical protein